MPGLGFAFAPHPHLPLLGSRPPPSLEWDVDYVQSFGQNIGENLVRTLVSHAISNEDCERKDCKGTHSLKTVLLEKLKQGFKNKLRSIFSRTELNVLYEKRRSSEVIFGNARPSEAVGPLRLWPDQNFQYSIQNRMFV